MANDFAISVKNLVKKFKDFTAVDDISFDVKKREIFAFLGPNGAGKTTTIKMLTTLLDPTSGQLFINGYNGLTDKNHVRASFGIVFQDPSVDDELTAYENMQLHASLYGVSQKEQNEKIPMLLQFVHLWDKQRDIVKTFSGGMKRRLEIARGLLHTPTILFLDEPTLGLDPQTRNSMWDYILQTNKNSGMTVFFTTHYLEEAEKMAQKIAIIDHGKIIALGSPEELKKQTKTKTLEQAFLQLTGKTIRDEQASGGDKMRMFMRKRIGR